MASRPRRVAGRPDQAWLVTLAMALLLLVILWLYLPPYHDAFLGDDYVQQWRIRDYLDAPQRAYEIFSPGWTNWYYRPLQNLWFLGNRLLFGLEPFGYYYLGACAHLLATALLFHVSRRLGAGRLGGFAAAVLFGISAQHQLTVSWISSIGNVASLAFSLATVAIFLTYLRPPSRRWLLGAAFVTFLLSLLAHEEGFLLPIFLLFVWYSRRYQPRPAGLLAGAAAAGLVMIGYVALQLGRDNIHVGIDAGFGRQLLGGLLSTAYAPFLATVAFRLLRLDALPVFQSIVAPLAASPLLAGAFLLAIAALAAAWFRWGRRPVRLGLAWAGLHLAFVYASLWAQDPELVDSRHTYGALAGLALAAGATLAQAIGRRAARPGAITPALQWRLAAAALIVFAIAQIQGGRRTAAGVQVLMDDLARTEAQLMALLPEVTPATKLFATRFTLSPPYFAPAAAVWYDEPHLEGSDLAALRQYPRLSPDFHVFDQFDGRLLRVMPELQAHRETILLWREPPVVAELQREGEQPEALEIDEYGVVSTSAAEPRVGLQVQIPPGSTAVLTYRLAVPPGARLAFALSGAPGQTFRVRARTAAGQDIVLFEHSLDGADRGVWHEQLVPLGELAGREVTLAFEVRGAPEPAAARWANPRLVLD